MCMYISCWGHAKSSGDDRMDRRPSRSCRGCVCDQCHDCMHCFRHPSLCLNGVCEIVCRCAENYVEGREGNVISSFHHVVASKIVIGVDCVRLRCFFRCVFLLYSPSALRVCLFLSVTLEACCVLMALRVVPIYRLARPSRFDSYPVPTAPACVSVMRAPVRRSLAPPPTLLADHWCCAPARRCGPMVV